MPLRAIISQENNTADIMENTTLEETLENRVKSCLSAYSPKQKQQKQIRTISMRMSPSIAHLSRVKMDSSNDALPNNKQNVKNLNLMDSSSDNKLNRFIVSQIVEANSRSKHFESNRSKNAHTPNGSNVNRKHKNITVLTRHDSGLLSNAVRSFQASATPQNNEHLGRMGKNIENDRKTKWFVTGQVGALCLARRCARLTGASKRTSCCNNMV